MYPQEIMVGAIFPNGGWSDSAQSLTQAAATYGAFDVHYPMIVQRMTFRISTAVNNLTSSVIGVNLLTNLGNATPTTTSITTLTIPNGTALGKLVYKNCSPTYCPFGSQLQFTLQTQGALGGTPAGAGFSGFYAVLSPEDFTNSTVTLASV